MFQLCVLLNFNLSLKFNKTHTDRPYIHPPTRNPPSSDSSSSSSLLCTRADLRFLPLLLPPRPPLVVAVVDGVRRFVPLAGARAGAATKKQSQLKTNKIE